MMIQNQVNITFDEISFSKNYKVIHTYIYDPYLATPLRLSSCDIDRVGRSWHNRRPETSNHLQNDIRAADD